MKPFKKMNSQNTALLIVDVINSCAHEKCEIPEWKIYFSKIRSMIPRLNAFIEKYRTEVGGLIIFGKTLPWRQEYLAENVNELYSDKRFSYYSKDTSGFAEEFYGITPQKDDLVIDKNTNDALANPKLIKELEKRGIKYIVTTGIFTDGCVLATVVGGFSKGYNFIILKDLVETTDSKTRQEIQKYLLDYTFPYLFGRVITSDELINSFR
jgi:nicotinamidase-related amidase